MSRCKKPLTDSVKLRRNAVKILRERASTEPENREPPSNDDSRKILHELQVHQIELEMQNEELRRSKEELDSSQAKYFDLYDLAPIGYVTLSKTGVIQEANLTFATMLDRTRRELINQPLASFIVPADQDSWQRYLQQLPDQKPSNICELRMIKKKSGSLWVRIKGGIVEKTDGVPVLRTVVSDISAQKRSDSIYLSRLHLLQFAETHSLEETLVETLNELEKLTESYIGFYHFYDETSRNVALQTWSTRTSTEFCRAEGSGSHYPLEKAGVWVDCIRAGKPVIHNDYASLPHRKGLPDGHAAVVRELVVPVKRANQIVAILGVGNKSAEYSQEDVTTVSLFADLAFEIIKVKQREMDLREREEKYRAMIEAFNGYLYICSKDFRIEFMNEKFIKRTGYNAVGEYCYKTLHDLDSVCEWCVNEQVFAGKSVCWEVKSPKDGRWYEINNSPIYNMDGTISKQAMIVDITERKEAEEAIKKANEELERRVVERTAALAAANESTKRVSFELIWAEEQERERIAAELHDQVGQSLLLAKMKLDSLANKTRSALLHSYAEEATSLLQAAIHDIRSLTFRMRPPILDTAGIETALKWLCSSVSSDYHLPVDFVSDGQPKLMAPAARYTLYQIVRELLLNVVKHAGAGKAHLSIKTDSDMTVVQLTDNGVGFNPEEAHLKHIDKSSYGLYNVQQRIDTLGGRITIDSSPGCGTSILIRVPLADIDQQQVGK